MPRFSQSSLDKLFTCDHKLVEICNEAIKLIDFALICGYRGEEAQNKAFAEGASKLKWPDGKHNKIPSMAMDLCPYRNGLQWNDREAFILLAGIILGIAASNNIKIRWGGDFDGDLNLKNNNFIDLGHFELV